MPSHLPRAKASGFAYGVLAELARIHICARDLGAGLDGRQPAGRQRTLRANQIEVCDAMTARRDAAIRLQQMLADDVARYEGSMSSVHAGLVMDMLVPDIGGTIRRTLSEVVAEFEASRHRFRLALVAAVDNRKSAVQIGEAFAFSRRLASRYLKEARANWPELGKQSIRKAQAG